VHVTGLDGMGKRKLAKAVGHFMMERRYMWGDIFWLPSTRKNKDNHISSQLWRLFELLVENKQPPKKFLSDERYRMVIQGIMDQLYEKKAVIIINTIEMVDKSIRKLCIFFANTKNVKVIRVVHQNNKPIKSRNATGFPCTEKEIAIGPLDFQSTVALFGRYCVYVSPNDCRAPLNNLLTKRTESTFKVLGEGIPTKNIISAKNMTRPEYEKLVDRETPIMDLISKTASKL
jgi:hypothetical protein